MRTLSLKTTAMRPEERRTQSKPCLVDALQNRPAHVFGQHQNRIPKAFLSSRSLHGRYYYTKMRTARGRGARDAYAAACGMRWNFYLSSGKHTPHFAPHEHHTVAIASGLMSEMKHSKETAKHVEAHAHSSGCYAPVAIAQGGTFTQGIVQATQITQAANLSVQDSAGPGNPQHVTFSFSIFAPANAEPAIQGARLRTETTHHAHVASFSGAMPLLSSFASTQADAGVQRQMDISLTIAYNPLSQLSYVPTYQVGAYAPSFAAAPMPPTSINFDSQGFSAAAPQGTTAAVKQREVGYFGSAKRKAVALKVAQAADTVPE